MPIIEQLVGELISVDTDQKSLKLRVWDQMISHEMERQYELDLTDAQFFDLVGSTVLCKLSDNVVRQITLAATNSQLDF